ncbi:putative holin [Gallaecimonas kandeliae]|uniref:putative holin n=1 Tax=Gallaecimonas kandeliae TaxID=3029055 RepID=UPI00264A3BAC|nr:putative holin [Gallaecimonas kandeliae]WKE65057.1 putative holin [Gallaecimonas kandeliae]
MSRRTAPRLTLAALLAVLLLLAIGELSPVKLPVVLYKVCLVQLGVVLGYWLDRTLYPYARPHLAFEKANDACRRHEHELARTLGYVAAALTIRRALIVIACVLGLTLGL